MFSHILHSFSKNYSIHQLEKIFLKNFFLPSFSLAFISICGYNQAFWLNLIIPWTFSKTNLWFNACFELLMWITYSILSCKLVTSFSTFSIFILSNKNGKSLQSSCTFPGYWALTSRKYPSSLSSFSFLWNLH